MDDGSALAAEAVHDRTWRDLGNAVFGPTEPRPTAAEQAKAEALTERYRLRSEQAEASLLETATCAFGLSVTLFWLVRRPPSIRSDESLGAVCVVAAALLLPLLYDYVAQPHGRSSAACARWVGLVAALASASALKENFSVVPAMRGLTSRGPYAIVRHPMYAAYLVFDASFWLDDRCLPVFGLWCFEVGMFYVRILVEERCLMQSQAYSEYAHRVRYRLLPGLL